MQGISGNSDITFRIYTHSDEISSHMSEIEVLYVLKGKGAISYTKQKEMHSISEDDIFVLNPFEMHRIVMEEDCRILSLIISTKLMTAIVPETEYISINCRSYLFSENNQKKFNIIRMDFSKLFNEFDKKKDNESLGIRCSAAQLLLDLVKFFAENNEENSSHVSCGERINRVTKFIDIHYAENITLNEIAKQTYLTTNYLSHLFKKELGSTFTEYLTDVRVQNAVIMLKRNESVTNTAAMTGFPSTNAFIKAFKQRYEITPGQYQKQKVPVNRESAVVQYNKQNDCKHLFDKLYSYSTKTADDEFLGNKAEICGVSVDMDSRKEVLKHNWRFSINGGYAKEILLGSVQSSIIKVQKEIHFSYIRVKGIFDNEIPLCTRKENGQLSYNYVYIDELIDFILSVDALPWIELGYMPSAIASSMKKVYTSGSILSYPVKIEEWEQTIRELITHLKDRYGEAQIRKWLFTPFTEISFVTADYFTEQEYFEILDASVKAIRDVERGVKLVLGISYDGTYGLAQHLISHLIDNNIEIYMWSLKIFNCAEPDDGEGLNIMALDETFPLAVSPDKDYVHHEFEKIEAMMKKNGLDDVSIVVSEWNSTVWQRDLCNDTCYKSCYIVKNILENYDAVKGMSYWKISDQSDELLPSIDIFHGGFGLITRNGIPKAAYKAMQLLCRMGNQLVKRGRGYFITSDKDSLQIYLYNYCHYDTLYRYRHTANISKSSRYNVFQNNENIQFNINIKNLKEGRYIKKMYSINRDSGSAYDEWAEIGSPQQLSREEIEILMSRTYPSYYTEEEDIQKDYRINCEVQPHEVKLIILSYQQ